MRAVVLSAPGTVFLREVPRIPPRAGQVQIRVRYCGICGSDIGIVYGHAHRYPLIPGHEFSGVVAAAAPGWEYLVGREVTACPVIGCGRCPLCRAGDATKCLQYDFLGSRSDGAYAEYVNVPGRNVLPLGALTLRRGALAEPLAVAVHAVRRAQASALGVAAVVGAGPIGLLVAQVCRVMGAREVLVLDVDDAKVALARRHGLQNSLNPQKGAAAQALRALDAALGADTVFECSGSGAGLESALALAAPGGCLVMVGIHKRKVSLSSAATRAVMKKELLITGAWVSNFAPKQGKDDWSIALELLGGAVDAEALVSREISLEEVPRALENIRGNPGGELKTMIRLP